MSAPGWRSIDRRSNDHKIDNDGRIMTVINIIFAVTISIVVKRTVIIVARRVFQPSYGNVPKPDGPVLEEYRLRSFSITASGVCNLGDFVRYASPPSSTRHRQPVGKRESCPASVSGTPQHQPYANTAATAATAATATSATGIVATASSHTVCTEFSRFRKPRYARAGRTVPEIDSGLTLPIFIFFFLFLTLACVSIPHLLRHPLSLRRSSSDDLVARIPVAAGFGRKTRAAGDFPQGGRNASALSPLSDPLPTPSTLPRSSWDSRIVKFTPNKPLSSILVTREYPYVRYTDENRFSQVHKIRYYSSF